MCRFGVVDEIDEEMGEAGQYKPDGYLEDVNFMQSMDGIKQLKERVHLIMR